MNTGQGATELDDCEQCVAWQLRFLVGIRLAGDLVPLLGYGEPFADVVDHAAASYARFVDNGGHPDGWPRFWAEYSQSVETAGRNPDANERRSIWLDHAQFVHAVPSLAPETDLGGPR